MISFILRCVHWVRSGRSGVGNAPVVQEPSIDAPGDVWSIVANIKREHPYGPGGAETRSGTRQFRGGTKVYINGLFYGSCDAVIAIGLHRKSRRLITCVAHVRHFENFRAKMVYEPSVLRRIQEDDRLEILTKSKAEIWAAELPKWQDLWLPKKGQTDE